MLLTGIPGMVMDMCVNNTKICGRIFRLHYAGFSNLWMEETDLWILLIITVEERLSNKKPTKHAFSQFKTEQKYTSATLHSSDLTPGIHCSKSAS
jgi:hypothetical protein